MTSTRRVCIVTGSRAEWGLLAPVTASVASDRRLSLQLVVAGSHLLPPAETWREVGPWEIAAKVPMQTPGATGRAADAAALGRGVSGFAEAFARLGPDWVVVLGDRIEAFAAASAGSVGGWAVAHIHAGDRAEGVADEAMRHAITKLAHLHLAATQLSMERIIRMGEPPERVRLTGSPAIDALASIPPLDDARFDALGRPEVVLLLHPAGLEADAERGIAESVASGVRGMRVLWLAPNWDPGRDEIVRVMQAARDVQTCEHLPRAEFVGLLKRLAANGGALVGNSSAGLIEAAALRCPVVDIGPRQSGRERPNNVIHVPECDADAVRRALDKACAMDRTAISHPYGDGAAGPRIAAALAEVDPHTDGCLRKHNTY